MTKILTLTRNLLQEVERYNKELIEIERVVDFRWEENQQLKQQIEKMKCCANCKHALQGEYDDFENCGNCHATECECEIKSPTKNSSGKYHDWDDKCDKWELAERIQED